MTLTVVLVNDKCNAAYEQEQLGKWHCGNLDSSLSV